MNTHRATKLTWTHVCGNTFVSIEANFPSSPVSCGMLEEGRRDKISGEDRGGEQSRADKVAVLHLP